MKRFFAAVAISARLQAFLRTRLRLRRLADVWIAARSAEHEPRSGRAARWRRAQPPVRASAWRTAGSYRRIDGDSCAVAIVVASADAVHGPFLRELLHRIRALVSVRAVIVVRDIPPRGYACHRWHGLLIAEAIAVDVRIPSARRARLDVASVELAACISLGRLVAIACPITTRRAADGDATVIAAVALGRRTGPHALLRRRFGLRRRRTATCHQKREGGQARDQAQRPYFQGRAPSFSSRAESSCADPSPRLEPLDEGCRHDRVSPPRRGSR